MDEQNRLEEELSEKSERLQALLETSEQLSRRNSEVIAQAEQVLRDIERAADRLRALVLRH